MIVLDTHAWVWLCSNPEKLSIRVQKVIRAEKALGIAAVSCWELAMLVSRKRLELDRDPLEWMEDSLIEFGIELLPLTPTIGVVSVSLGEFHGDPADRLIVATAQVHSATLVTKDRAILDLKLISTVW